MLTKSSVMTLAILAFGAAAISFSLAPAVMAKASSKTVKLAKNEVPSPNSAGLGGDSSEDAKAATAKVDGFRSAKFGMTEAEVRKAILRDFKVGKKSIDVEENKQERTRILTANVVDLLPGGGNAKVSYVMGYKSGKLIQVSAVWSKATDEKLSAQQLFSNANVLQSYFGEQGFAQDSIAMNLPTNGGLIMFRGADAKKRTALLMLQGQYRETKDKQRILTPSALMLFYVENAEKPDIYRIPAGLF